jgi:succinate dehydrogenase / fumarate reductase cytochrome b subunit
LIFLPGCAKKPRLGVVGPRDMALKRHKKALKEPERTQTMADVNRGNRPLSPHLQVYRPQLTSITSILTRITGNALIVASLMIVWWLLAASTGPEYFAVANGFVTSWFGDLVMFLSLWALWYHTLAGIRHLIWDNAKMLEIENAEMLGWIAVIGSVVLTVLSVIVLW